jgi:hypothetical protein
VIENTELLQITDKDGFTAFMNRLGDAGLIRPR